MKGTKQSCCLLVCLLWPSLASALTIVAPQDGAKVEAGSSVKVQVRADAGERLTVVKMLFEEDEDFHLNAATGLYEKIITIPRRIFGLDTIKVIAANDQGRELEAEVKILITIPSSTVLTGLRVDEDQRTLYARVGERDELSVYGRFSDGIERDVSSAFMGTAYTSSDEKVVTVDADGLVTSKGPGTARITIRNGRLELTVEAVVKPKP